MIKQRILLLLVSLLTTVTTAQAQQALQKDYSFVLEIPELQAVTSSPTHLYALSATEGLAVFRAHADTLQWLYTSPGMQKRGDEMTADIRFAYLFGMNRRLTVLEPTSVLGVYSSTTLPTIARDAKRLGQNLYLALDSLGIGRLSLRTPQSVDSSLVFVGKQELNGASVINLETYKDRLIALAGNNRLLLFSQTDGQVQLTDNIDLNRPLTGIFTAGDRLLGSDKSGTVYEIGSRGNLSRVFAIDEPVSQISRWGDWLIVKGVSGKIWTSYRNASPQLWKSDPSAGNYYTVNKGNFWFSEYNTLSRVIPSQSGSVSENASGDRNAAGEQLKLQPIKRQVVPYPHPLLLPLNLKGHYPYSDVQFTYRSDIKSAEIKKEGFYWQPGPNETGVHHFTIIASGSNGQTDSTSFSVDVRSFNAPPRFTPLRPMTITVGESFSLPFSAIDPDGSDRNLIRYLGVDLPEGAAINEKSGAFTWTPKARQTGENTFRVIATDQYGAASSVEVTLNVVEEQRGEQ